MNRFNERRQAFLMSCNLFKAEIEEYQELIKRKSLTEIDQQTIVFLKKDIASVNDTFRKLKESCGTASVVIMWKYYIEGKTKKEIANQFKIGKVHLSRNILYYEHMMFD